MLNFLASTLGILCDAVTFFPKNAPGPAEKLSDCAEIGLADGPIIEQGKIPRMQFQGPKRPHKHRDLTFWF